MKIPSLMEMFRDHDDAPQWMREKSPRRRPRRAIMFQPMVAEVLELRSTPSTFHVLDHGGLATAENASAVGQQHVGSHAHSFLAEKRSVESDSTLVDAQGVDSIIAGCCGQDDSNLDPRPAGAEKTANPELGKSNVGFIVGADGKVTNVYGDPRIDPSKLNPITDKNWQQVGTQSTCASIVIQLPGGGFGYFHLGESGGEKALKDFLAGIKEKLDKAKAPAPCLQINSGTLCPRHTGASKALEDAVKDAGIKASQMCSIDIPKIPNEGFQKGKNHQFFPYEMWLDPNGKIHWFKPIAPPANAPPASPPGKL